VNPVGPDHIDGQMWGVLTPPLLIMVPLCTHEHILLFDRSPNQAIILELGSDATCNISLPTFPLFLLAYDIIQLELFTNIR